LRKYMILGLLALMVSLVATFAINAVAKENPPGCKNDTPKEKNPNCRGDGGGGGGGGGGGDGDGRNGGGGDGGGGGGAGGGGGGGGGGGDGAVITQESEQETESGDVTQSYDISSTGDNSNQCVGIQGVANTGNAQNQIGVLQYGSESGDFEFDEVGSTITVSPENSTVCDQQVNQAATASG
jgi:hypothetical protein